MSDDHASVGELGMRWWRNAIDADTGRARRTRAALRRADTPLAVLGVSAVHELHGALSEAGHGMHHRPDWPDRLAVIAVALAHVKDGRGAAAARRFGAGDPPPLSAIRFNALIRAEAPRDVMRPLVRALKVIDGGTDVRRLVKDLYWWNDRIRTEWCFEYYGATDAKPLQQGEETRT